MKPNHDQLAIWKHRRVTHQPAKYGETHCGPCAAKQARNAEFRGKLQALNACETVEDIENWIRENLP